MTRFAMRKVVLSFNTKPLTLGIGMSAATVVDRAVSRCFPRIHGGSQGGECEAQWGTMSTLKHSTVNRGAFARGFWSGLFAPAMLFQAVNKRTQPPLMMIPEPVPPSSPMGDAWAHVSGALVGAVTQHYEQNYAAKPRADARQSKKRHPA